MEAIQTTGPFKVRAMIDVPTGISEPLPVILFAHGIGERSNTNLELVMKYGPLKQVRAGEVLPFKFIGIHPQMIKTENGKDLTRWKIGMLMEALQYVLDTYPTKVDKNRIYGMAVSMGGAAMWDIAGTEQYVSKFAAFVIMCGADGPDDGQVATIVKSKVPILLAHAIDDKTATATYTVSMNAMMKINRLAKRSQVILMRNGLFGHIIWDKVLNPVTHPTYEWLQLQNLGNRIDDNKFDAAIKILDDTVSKLEALK